VLKLQECSAWFTRADSAASRIESPGNQVGDHARPRLPQPDPGLVDPVNVEEKSRTDTERNERDNPHHAPIQFRAGLNYCRQFD
jgi:hypothetical protein